MLPVEAINTFAETAGTQMGLAPDEVENLKSTLLSVESQLESTDTFTYMGTIQEDSFGGTFSATNLAYHHGLAHQVMDETLQGLRSDMQALITNVTKAAELIQSADDDAGGNLQKRQAVVQAFTSMYGSHSHEERAHTHARNHQHDPWSQDA